MTSTRRTIPAPPPNGVSSTWPPLSGVCSRGLSARTSWPPAIALATWRCERNQSNHSGKSVTTSSCISSACLGALGDEGAHGLGHGVAEEGEVHVDELRRDVHAADSVADQRDEERRRGRSLAGAAREGSRTARAGTDRARTAGAGAAPAGTTRAGTTPAGPRRAGPARALRSDLQHLARRQ